MRTRGSEYEAHGTDSCDGIAEFGERNRRQSFRSSNALDLDRIMLCLFSLTVMTRASLIAEFGAKTAEGRECQEMGTNAINSEQGVSRVTHSILRMNSNLVIVGTMPTGYLRKLENKLRAYVSHVVANLGMSSSQHAGNEDPALFKPDGPSLVHSRHQSA